MGEGRVDSVVSSGSVQFGLVIRMVYNYPQDSSRSPIPLYRAYSGESASKKSRDVMKAFVDQTNQSSLRKILISQKRSENMKMGKSFSHRMKKSAHSAREVGQVSLVVAGGRTAAAAQPPLQPQLIEYKRVHSSAPTASSASAGSQLSHHPPKPSLSISAMDTIHVDQGPTLPLVEKIQPSAKAVSTSLSISQIGKKSEEGIFVMGQKMGSVLLEARSFIYSNIPAAVDALKQGLIKGGEALLDIDELVVEGGSVEEPGQMGSMITYVRLVHDILIQASQSPPASLQIRRLMWITPGGRLTNTLKSLENLLAQKMAGVEPEKIIGREGKRSLDVAMNHIETNHQGIILDESAPPAKLHRSLSTQSNDFPEAEVFDDMVVDPKEASPPTKDQHLPPAEEVHEKTPPEASVLGGGSGETLESKVEKDMQLLMKKASNFIDPFDVSTT